MEVLRVGGTYFSLAIFSPTDLIVEFFHDEILVSKIVRFLFIVAFDDF